MTFDDVKSVVENIVALNKHIGIQLIEVGDGRAVGLLPDRPEIKNHIGSQHAAGLFAVAEAASGGAVMGALLEQIASVRPLAKGAQIKYLKIAQGAIKATATLGLPKAALLDQLSSAGKAEFPVNVELHDGAGTLVATVTVDWHLKKLG